MRRGALLAPELVGSCIMCVSLSKVKAKWSCMLDTSRVSSVVANQVWDGLFGHKGVMLPVLVCHHQPIRGPAMS